MQHILEQAEYQKAMQLYAIFRALNIIQRQELLDFEAVAMKHLLTCQCPFCKASKSKGIDKANKAPTKGKKLRQALQVFRELSLTDGLT